MDPSSPARRLLSPKLTSWLPSMREKGQPLRAQEAWDRLQGGAQWHSAPRCQQRHRRGSESARYIAPPASRQTVRFCPPLPGSDVKAGRFSRTRTLVVTVSDRVDAVSPPFWGLTPLPGRYELTHIEWLVKVRRKTRTKWGMNI